jgi:hypothetical protein
MVPKTQRETRNWKIPISIELNAERGGKTKFER